MPQYPLNIPVGANLSTAITVNTGTQVKTGPGVLMGLSVTGAGTTWVMSFYDGTSSAGTLLAEQPITQGVVDFPPIKFTTGLFVNGTGTAGSAMVSYF